MSRRHVTIEDVVDEDNQQQNSTGFSELDLNTINQDASQRQAWNEVDALEEQARSEKLKDESDAKANANETARIFKEAQQNSGI